MPSTALPPQAAILAGGLGTRMHPRTASIPKFLLGVAGRPFGAWLLDRLAAAGFGEALICIGHLGSAVQEAMGDRWGSLRLRYADEGPSLLGTAGALRRALPHLSPTFLVTYGDSYLPFDYLAPLRDLEAHPEALGTMAVYRNQDRLDASNTAIQGALVARYRKRKLGDPVDPGLDHIDYGAMALRREVIAALPEGAVVGLEVVQADLAARGCLRALPVMERFHEVGSEAGLRDLEALLSGSAGEPS
ncbi:NTP transferase domain-containing protein [Chondromyces apiculatus]|uniref:Mannose-1-phosphate guanyltransferase n=1 Tax=Chondromyces apiculatus DSM 436 TaxID=1192034 RepID=A0A017TG26_9BACT|nr:NTP transferase domain-containing protein [Chondromyces apiculatus]EYF07877.1 Mannose-1-phosphate guanyltransferase [Chondromyces apiculatus DSM 436]